MFPVRQSRLLLIAVCLTAIALAQSPAQDPQFKAEMTKGHQALGAHKLVEAEKAYKEAIKISHNTCQSCYLALAGVEWKLGDSRAAESACDHAIAASTTDKERAIARANKGNFLMAMGQDKNYKKAESEYRAAIQLDNSIAETHYFLGLSLMRQMRDDEGKREMESYLQAAPGGSGRANAQLMIANPRRARERYAPELTAITLRGDHISLRDFAGKVVVLDFWATWCPPCVASVPDLKELLKKYPTDKLVLISISADKKEEAWRDFIAKKEMNWTHVFDQDHSICDAFNVHVFPTYMVVDGEGIIREELSGEESSRSVASRLKDSLKKMPELNRPAS